MGLARLAAESVRGAGLRLAGVVLTGWPDPPSRTHLDDRALLEALADVTVLLHPSDEAWPVEEWLAVADAPVAARGWPTPATLDPYRAWPARPVGDPRATPRPEIMAALLEIVGTEGPMLASRA